MDSDAQGCGVDRVVEGDHDDDGHVIGECAVTNKNWENQDDGSTLDIGFANCFGEGGIDLFDDYFYQLEIKMGVREQFESEKCDPKNRNRLKMEPVVGKQQIKKIKMCETETDDVEDENNPVPIDNIIDNINQENDDCGEQVECGKKVVESISGDVQRGVADIVDEGVDVKMQKDKHVHGKCLAKNTGNIKTGDSVSPKHKTSVVETTKLVDNKKVSLFCYTSFERRIIWRWVIRNKYYWINPFTQ